MLLIGAGCENGLLTFKWSLSDEKQDVEKGFVEAQLEELPASLAYRDTIAEQGWIEGLRLMRVRGYGIVAGLGTRGSRECPQRIRNLLIQEMYKHEEFSAIGLKAAPITPGEYIDDPDTAVVTVEGEIPAAAPAGTTFDVIVRALPGTQTVSLEGGRLYTASMQMYRDSPSGGSVEGKTLAQAAGAIFINPFRDDTSEEAASIDRKDREATIIGGGVSTESRRLRFVLSRPSYQLAERISHTNNARYPSSRKEAEATSPTNEDLRVPAE
jgi:flagellar basal body P-ring protein FlgI